MVTFSFIGEAAEAFVYVLIAVSFFFTIPRWWSPSWVVFQFFIVIIGRVAAITFIYYSFLKIWPKQTLTFYELMFIAYGGMIRGAIAFALVMKIPHVGSKECH